MLIGKCPDCPHLNINRAVRNKLEEATNKVTNEELFLSPIDQNAKGRAIKRQKNEVNPNNKVGSPIEFIDRSDAKAII